MEACRADRGGAGMNWAKPQEYFQRSACGYTVGMVRVCRGAIGRWRYEAWAPAKAGAMPQMIEACDSSAEARAACERHALSVSGVGVGISIGDGRGTGCPDRDDTAVAS